MFYSKYHWTPCTCGHIAQDHNVPVLNTKNYKCDRCKDCKGYDGKRVLNKRNYRKQWPIGKAANSQ